jgi:DNA-binding CsgD family transcriptional regulator
MQLRWGKHRTDLLIALDGLGQAMMVCDARGRMIHQTAALTHALHQDPEDDRLCQAMLQVAAGLATFGSAPLVYTDALFEPAERSVQTAYAAYRITGSLYRSPFSSSPALVLLALERTSLVPRTEHELRDAYGLTRAEIRVASLLVKGMSNPEIAGELYVSLHTVRRHTEQILFKTKSRTRSELALKILH